MTEKLKDYQVLDVLSGGTFYKVRHKVTNNVFAWKACNCSTYSNEQIQNIINEVKTISREESSNLIHYYDTILHVPSKTLYFVLEYNTWQSVEELIATCKATETYIAEKFLWYLLLELARVCKVVEGLKLKVLRKCVSSASIFVGENCKIRVNCFELGPTPPAACWSLIRQAVHVVHVLCNTLNTAGGDVQDFCYSDDLRDVVNFLVDDRNADMRPDIVLYHPTVLANSESSHSTLNRNAILVPVFDPHLQSEVNKCDSDKAIELCRTNKPALRTQDEIMSSPIYSNIYSKRDFVEDNEDANSSNNFLSPTLAALALELPGYVPRSRRPYADTRSPYNPQRVSEETLSQHWMTRLIALRQREETLNLRERELIAKEIVNSPNIKIIPLNDSLDMGDGSSNGITLPPIIGQVAKEQWESRRRRRRFGSVRSKGYRKSCSYEDLDSSLSADAGDESIVVTSKKITRENMPQRNIFSDISTKKVHFTSSNPFVESDDSVTLTFYELENADNEVQQHQVLKDIQKFKYLDTEKVASEKRAAVHQWYSSPSKHAKTNKTVFSGLTIQNSLQRTPSKSILMSSSCNTSRYCMNTRSHGSSQSGCSKVSEGGTQTPRATDVRKSKRKSLLPFKTPFKFMTSTKN